MHSSGSFIKTCLERIRAAMDDASLAAKFDNDYLVAHCLGPAMADVLSRINLTSVGRIVLKHDITLVDDVKYYKLPPCIEQVVRLATVSTEGIVLTDLLPQDLMNWSGRGWAVEGVPGSTELYLEKGTLGVETVQLWYVSNGDFLPQLATGGVLTETDGVQRLQLNTTSTLGQLDRRTNAYAGQVLRLLPASPGVWEERIVSRSYKEGSNFYVELRRPFTDNATGTYDYELAPAGSSTLCGAIAMAAALQLATPRKISGELYQRIMMQYRSHLKTISDRMKLLQSRVPQHINKNTVDNSEYGSIFGFLGG